MQCLEKVFKPVTLSTFLLCYNHKQYILLGFYVIDQHKVVYNCELEGKIYVAFKVCFFFRNKNLKNMAFVYFQPVNTLSNRLLWHVSTSSAHLQTTNFPVLLCYSSADWMAGVCEQ